MPKAKEHTREEIRAMILKAGKQTDAQIAAAANGDPDAPLWTDTDFASAERVEAGKVPVTIRLDAKVVTAYKAMGKGWQTRMNTALLESLRPQRELGEKLQQFSKEMAELRTALEDKYSPVTRLAAGLGKPIRSKKNSK